MGVISLNRERIVSGCDKVIELFLYILIFSLGFSPAIIEVAATIIILAWIAKKLLVYQPVHTYLNIPILVYIFAVFLSVLFSSNFSLSLRNFFSKTIEYLLLFFIVAEAARQRQILKNIIIVMLVSAAMIGVDAVLQYLLGVDLLRFRTLEAGRVTASFSMPGDLAGYLTPLLCLALSIVLLKIDKKIRYLVGLESILLLVLLIITIARGAWLGFIVALCFLGVVENKKIFYLTVALFVVLVFVLPHFFKTPDDILLRLRSMFALTDGSSLDRRTIWQAAVAMVRDKPLCGHGLSTFMGIFPQYAKDYYYLREGIIPYAHNCYLQIAAESGLVGLVGFLTVLGTFVIYTITSLARIKDRFKHAVLSGVSAGIIASLVHSAVDTNLYSLQLSMLFWIMLGLNAGLQREAANRPALQVRDG